MSPILSLPDHHRELLTMVSAAAAACHSQIFLVGGVVRDLLLQGTTGGKDLDFLVLGQPAGAAHQVARECKDRIGGEVKFFPRFLTAKLVAPDRIAQIGEVDFARARHEVYATPGALPEVQPANTIEEDLGRRDFAINAMALSVDALCATESGKSVSGLPIIDLFQGQKDLATRQVRILHERSFLDDPTRIFRAARYVTRLSGTIEPGTFQQLLRASGEGAFKTISALRILVELRKIASEVAWTKALASLFEWKVIEQLGFALSEKRLQQFSRNLDRLQAIQAPHEAIYLAMLTALSMDIAPDELAQLPALKGLNNRRLAHILVLRGASARSDNSELSSQARLLVQALLEG